MPPRRIASARGQSALASTPFAHRAWQIAPSRRAPTHAVPSTTHAHLPPRAARSHCDEQVHAAHVLVAAVATGHPHPRPLTNPPTLVAATRGQEEMRFSPPRVPRSIVGHCAVGRRRLSLRPSQHTARAPHTPMGVRGKAAPARRPCASTSSLASRALPLSLACDEALVEQGEVGRRHAELGVVKTVETAATRAVVAAHLAVARD